MNKIEAYFIKTLKERAGLLLILTLLLLVPNFGWRIFFMFLMITLVLLPRDMCNGKFSLMMALPFSRNGIFWASYLFLMIFSIFPLIIGYSFESAIVSLDFWNIGYEILSTFIFANAYFGIAMLSVTFGFGNLGMPFLAFLADGFFGSIGKWHEPNLYRMISPIYQGNKFYALIFALLLLSLSYILFERKVKDR